MSDNTKIENLSSEMNDDALDNVAGGTDFLPPEYDDYFAGLPLPRKP